MVGSPARRGHRGAVGHRSVAGGRSACRAPKRCRMNSYRARALAGLARGSQGSSDREHCALACARARSFSRLQEMAVLVPAHTCARAVSCAPARAPRARLGPVPGCLHGTSTDPRRMGIGWSWCSRGERCRWMYATRSTRRRIRAAVVFDVFSVERCACGCYCASFWNLSVCRCAVPRCSPCTQMTCLS